MMTKILFCFLTWLVCLAVSSPATAPDIEQDEGNEREMAKAIRDELTELKEVVNLLKERVIRQELDAESKEAAETFAIQLLRQRRSANGALAGSSISTNESGIETEDLSRVLLGSHSITLASGIAYTHWGRSDCPSGSELVYTGTTAGAYYTNTGGGSNYLCMPLEPIYDEVETSAHGSRSLLYSAEFETSTAPAFADLHDQTPACAVCRAPPTRLTKLMVPGRNECPSSKWRLEYKGYLMASLYSHKVRTEFICMDRDAESIPGTTGSQDGSLFYMTEARCMSGGGLPCGPYVNGYELTCAVCTI